MRSSVLAIRSSVRQAGEIRYPNVLEQRRRKRFAKVLEKGLRPSLGALGERDDQADDLGVVVALRGQPRLVLDAGIPCRLGPGLIAQAVTGESLQLEVDEPVHARIIAHGGLISGWELGGEWPAAVVGHGAIPPAPVLDVLVHFDDHALALARRRAGQQPVAAAQNLCVGCHRTALRALDDRESHEFDGIYPERGCLTQTPKWRSGAPLPTIFAPFEPPRGVSIGRGAANLRPQCSNSSDQKAAGLYDPNFRTRCLRPSAPSRAWTTPAPSHEGHRPRHPRARLRLEHRGAAAPAPTPATAPGILFQIPDGFFRGWSTSSCRRRPLRHAPICFLPEDARRRQTSSRCSRREDAAEAGQTILAWRDVPSTRAARPGAAEVQPVIRQLFIAATLPDDADERPAFERKLYVIRRVIEDEVGADLIFPSFSSRTIASMM